MENYNLLKNSRIIKNANNKKNKKINELLLIRDEMMNNNIDNKIIQKYVNEQYEIINTEYQKNINKKIDNQKLMSKKRDDALQFLFKNKSFLEQNNANPEYIKEYVKNQYHDINKTYENDNINFID